MCNGMVGNVCFPFNLEFLFLFVLLRWKWMDRVDVTVLRREGRQGSKDVIAKRGCSFHSINKVVC